MSDNPAYLLVDAQIAPDTFLKVVKAKRLLALGEASSLSQAVRMADISRSAFYKYRHSVHAYTGEESRRIATLYCELRDEPGVLSSLITSLYQSGGNILTINQNIPVDGVASITVALRTGDSQDLIPQLEALSGVVSVRLLAND